MNPQLYDRVCIVTGAASGIGAAIAKALAVAGASVLLTDSNGDALRATAASLESAVTRIAALQHDVTDEAGWQRVMDTAASTFGGLDVLVNNAGVYLNKPLLEMTLSDLRRLTSVNLESVFMGTRAAVPLMRDDPKRRDFSASIVNMSSVAGLVGSAGGSGYSMTKGGVRLFTKAVALEFAHMNIRVNSVHPGLIATNMAAGIISQRASAQDTSEEDQMRLLAAQYPLGRIGQPANIADAVLFLAGEGSSFMTGSELVVDGGFTAR